MLAGCDQERCEPGPLFFGMPGQSKQLGCVTVLEPETDPDLRFQRHTRFKIEQTVSLAALPSNPDQDLSVEDSPSLWIVNFPTETRFDAETARRCSAYPVSV